MLVVWFNFDDWSELRANAGSIMIVVSDNTTDVVWEKMIYYFFQVAQAEKL